jgi:hypothetical protein
VVAPDLGMAGLAPLLVEARGRSNTAAVPVQVGAGSSATYRLRFYAAPADGVGRAAVATAAGPVLLFAAKDDAPSVAERAVKAAAALNALAEATGLGRPADVEARQPPALAVVGGAVVARATAEDAAAYAASPASVAAHWAALVGDYLAMFGRGERPTRLFATTARARALLELQSEVGFRPGAGVTALRMARLSPESQQKLKDMALLLAAPAQGQAEAAVEGVWEGQLQDADGVVKAVVVEMHLAGNRIAGTLAIGSKVAVKIPLQEVAVKGESLTFSVRRGGFVHVFAGTLSTGEVSGPVHEGSLSGPAVGRLSLRYARPPS